MGLCGWIYTQNGKVELEGVCLCLFTRHRIQSNMGAWALDEFLL